MKNNNFNVNNTIIRIIAVTALAVGTSLAAAKPENNDQKTNHNLAHYTKIAGRTIVHAVSRSAVKTADFADRAGKDTGKGIGSTANHGSEDGAHFVKVSAKKTGRFFRRVGRAVV